MGKANKVKKDLVDAKDMVFLIQTLKDIADNKYFTLLNKKSVFRRFGETFVEFFRMINLTKATHPLITNTNPATAIVVVTGEGSFLGEFNNKIIRIALNERERHEKSKFVAVGGKSVDRLIQYTPDIKVFEEVERKGLYETSVAVKKYLVDEVMSGRIGKVVICYSWPKTFDSIKPRIVKLLPCDELISKQAQFVESVEEVIEESDPSAVIGFLSNLWITTRIYEILIDTIIASAAAQSQFLDDSVEKMKKERNKTQLRFRKAKKGDIDKSLRETFSARMMSMKKPVEH